MRQKWFPRPKRVAQGVQKGYQHVTKKGENRGFLQKRDLGWSRGAFWSHFGYLFGRFWEVLGVIGKSFWEVLAGFHSHGDNLGSLCADWFHAVFLFGFCFELFAKL